MGKLKNRKYLNTTLPLDVFADLDKLAQDTKINKSRLVEEAVKDLLKKYNEGKK